VHSNIINISRSKDLKITSILDKLLEYKRSWIQHVNRRPRNRLPRVMKHYSSPGRRNHGRYLKRLLDTWGRNGSTSGPTRWQIYDDDFQVKSKMSVFRVHILSYFSAVHSVHCDMLRIIKPTVCTLQSIYTVRMVIPEDGGRSR